MTEEEIAQTGFKQKSIPTYRLLHSETDIIDKANRKIQLSVVIEETRVQDIVEIIIKEEDQT